MRRNRSPYAELASPILVGAATTLVIIVAVFLSYNANAGLPFVPTYDVSADVRDAQELVPGNEVRVGGHRVGVIRSIRAQRRDRGRTAARLGLKLELAMKPIRDDSKVTVRPRSPLGLKYLELEPGRRGRPIEAGGVLSVSRDQPIVDLDEVIDELDAPTRRDLQRVLGGLGTGLASRGAAFNDTITELRPLLRDAGPILRDLADPDTRIGAFVRSAARVSGELAPVSEPLAAIFADGEATLAALEAAGPELDATLDRAPRTLADSTVALHSLTPVLAKARRLTASVAPGARLLPATSTRLASALETGTPVLRRALRLSGDLDDALGALRRLGAVPAPRTFERLGEALTTLRPTVEFLAPYQTVCNYAGVAFRNMASAVSEGDENGTWLRFDAIGQQPENGQAAEPAPELHFNPYPHGSAPGQERECEAGNEPWLPGRQIGNAPGNQGVATDHTDASGR